MADVHAQVRAFGSLAQEVMDAGVAGVVAMRYNVYVVTAAQFVADLYAALARGQTLGQAVTWAASSSHAQPLRESPTSRARCRTGSCPWSTRPRRSRSFPRQHGGTEHHADGR